MKCCVLVRFVYEFIYLDAFIEHYLNLGFDKIIILYHDVVEGYIEENYKDKVQIYSVPNLGNRLPEAYKNLIPRQMDWVLHVDSDEFLLLHKKYFSIHDYIREKLTTFPSENINIIALNWVWIHKYDNLNDPVYSIIKRCKKQVGCIPERKNKELWIKSIFRRDQLQTFYIHCPLMRGGHRMYCNGEVLVFKDNPNSVRTVSYKDDSILYKDHALLHIATRSLNNAIFKSERIHESQVQRKEMNSKMALEHEVAYLTESSTSFEKFKLLIEHIGYKVKFPLKCMKLPEAQINVDDFLRVQDKIVNFESIDKSEEYYRLYSTVLNSKKIRDIIDSVVSSYNYLFLLS